MKTNTEEKLIDIQELWTLFLSKWQWFAISTTICLIATILYLSIVPSIYTRTASVLIKDESKNTSMSQGMGMFSELGLLNSNTNINNEILILESPALMEEVIKRLKLQENYIIRKNLRSTNLYHTNPVIVSFDRTESDEELSFKIHLLAGQKLKLTHFKYNGKKLKVHPISGELSKPLPTPIGNITIIPTDFYSEENSNKTILYTKRKIQNTAEKILTSLSVSLKDEQATILSLSISDPCIKRAEDILNTLISVYNEHWVQDKNLLTISTSIAIEERLKVIENELGDVDEDISLFKSENLVPDIKAVSDLYLIQANENKKAILSLNTQLAIINQIKEYLSKDSKSQLLPANPEIENATLATQIEDYNSLLLQHNSLLANSSEKNPLVKDMSESLLSMKQAINQSIDNFIITIHTQLENLYHSDKEIREQIASGPEQAKYLLSVERQQKIKEALYLYLLEKREENELSQAFTPYNTRIITPPYGKVTPTSPRKAMVLFLAMVIGLLFPGILLFIIQNMETTVQGQKDLKPLSTPFIGEVPLVKGTEKKILKKQAQTILVEDKNRNSINEAFRVIRSNLDFMHTNNTSSQITMFTSFRPGCGKTFVCINLAASMALKGEKILVIDMDLRRGSLSKYINSPQKGLSDYLSHHTESIEDAIIQMDSIDILPVGILPPNPSELLLNGRIEKLVEILKQQYHSIYLDCPPTGIVADSTIISKLADLTIFVIRVGLTDKERIPDLEEMYQEKRFKNMSVILNGVEYFYNKYGYGYN